MMWDDWLKAALLAVSGVSLGITIGRMSVRGVSQSTKVRGSGIIVNQSGSICGGDMVGGDLIKGSASAGRCKYCGAAQ